MKYILNESKKRTTNSYKINNIELDLDIPVIDNFDDYKFSNVKLKKDVLSNFNSKINLKHNKSDKITIDITKDTDDVLELEIKKAYIGLLEINIEENIKTNLIIKYKSKKDVFNNVKIVINTKENSYIDLTIINLLNDKSKNFIAIENNISSKAKVINNFIDIGSDIKISNINTILNDKSYYTLNNMYIGKNNNIIDMNYNIDIIGKNAVGKINVEGLLNDNAKKSFKGIIDFKKGSTKSVGEEIENVLLLSERTNSKSLPMLLCHEEDVIGSHGVSTGKIDDEKLFYLMSRGLSKKEASDLMINAKFNKIINKIPNKEIKEELIDIFN